MGEDTKKRTFRAGRPKRFNRALQADFIEYIKRTGHLAHSCEACGISRECYYKERRANPEFARLVDEAKEYYIEALEIEADRRARDGTDVPIYYKGERIGEKKEYSDALLQFRLKGLKPDMYRDRSDVNMDASVTIKVCKFEDEDGE